MSGAVAGARLRALALGGALTDADDLSSGHSRCIGSIFTLKG